tara:strand:+ start:2036 stop:2635 length:600 start_codon:yes stop_codon:yes gene_type:complete
MAIEKTRSQTVRIKTNEKEFMRSLNRKQKKHIPQATADAVNETAKKVIKALKVQTEKKLDRPKSTTINAYAMSRAVAKYPDATVFIKDAQGQSKYLKFVIDGGIDTKVVVPTPNAPMDNYGNIKGLKKGGSFSKNKVYRKIRSGTGVFDKKGKVLLAVIKDSVNYTKKLLPFFTIGEKVANSVIGKQMSIALKKQMKKK